MFSIITSIANLVIVYKLRLFTYPRPIEFVSLDTVAFNGDVHVDSLLLAKNEIQDISRITGNISLQVGDSMITISGNGIVIKAKDGLKVRSRRTGKLIFPVDFNQIPLPKLSSLSVPAGIKDIHKIRSPIDDDLTIRSDKGVKITGNEGVKIDSKSILLDGKQQIKLSSMNGSIIFEGERGITLNVHRLPMSNSMPNDNNEFKDVELQHKLCICGRNGRLFRLKLTSPEQTCNDVRFPESINPCI